MMPMKQNCPKCGTEFMGSDALGSPCLECAVAESKLRDRCKEFFQKQQRNGMLRQGSPVDDLMAFVQSERGRAADPSLEDTLPMILYFGNEQDREEFKAIIREVKPGMVAKPIP